MIDNYLLPQYIPYLNWQQPDGQIITFNDFNVEMVGRLSGYLEALDGGATDLGLPECLTQVKVPKVPYNTIDEQEAINSYLSHLAHSLWVSFNYPEFRIDLLTERCKNNILNGTSMFTYWRNENHYKTNYDLIGDASPGDPSRIFNFLRECSILGQAHEDTIVNLLEWCRNLSHYTLERSNANFIRHWNYTGHPPVERIINGTVLNDDKLNRVRHYVSGCHGTIGFLHMLLKIINIPVEYLHNEFSGHHGQAFFPSINRYLTHGDNPYSRVISCDKQIPYGELLMEPEQFHARFNKNGDKVNVGLDCYEIAVRNASTYLVHEYCLFISGKENKFESAMTKVYPKGSEEYNSTIEQIKTKSEKLGGCDNFMKEWTKESYRRMFKSL